MKKLLLYIFIPILAVLLMSHNVNAISPIINLNDYETFMFDSPKSDCQYSDGSVQSGVWFCYLPTETTLKTIITSTKYNFKKNDIVNFKLVLKSRDPGLDDWVQVGNPNAAWPFRLIQFDEVVDNNSYVDNQNGTNSVNMIFDVTLVVTADANNTAVGFNNITDFISYRANHTNRYDDLQVMLIGITGWHKTGSQVNKEQEQATQDAADNSATSGNSSTTDSQNATSSLLSVFTGFASVITNASATNCVINAPLNTSFGNDTFNVDLCALSLPPALGALTSIIAVMVIVPFAISMFNKFIGIMESFQR